MASDRFLRGLLVSVAVFIALLLSAYLAADFVETKADENGAQIVRDSVKRAARTCYAIEGRYPRTLSYLKENYGLVFDDNSYFIVYDAFASNIMPHIFVLPKEEER